MQITVEPAKLRHNIRYIRNRLGNGFCAVVKANAYGHGAAIAGYIEPLADSFMVATYDEAVTLCGLVSKPVYVLDGDISPFLSGAPINAIPTVCSSRALDALVRAGRRTFSVAVDTGMNRLGARPDELGRIVSACKRYDIRPASVYSHIYNGIASAGAQTSEFEKLTREPILRGCRHLFSSCALALPSTYLYDMTRCGIAMYGFADGTETALTARAQIADIALLPRGSHVGYGEFTLARDTLVATVKCGYADGLRRTRFPVYLKVRGKRCPIIGMPCMDLCMIDITGVPARVGEYAYLISDRADVEYLAKIYDTIVYEVLTGLNGRAKRIYIR